MSGSFQELLAEEKRISIYPLLAGAIAVSKSLTLVTDRANVAVFLQAIQDEGLESVPGTLRPRVENVRVYNRPYLTSEQVDFVFAHMMGENGITFRYEDAEYRYEMTDEAASAYISCENFTEEELAWLWTFAQMIHVENSKPLERR